MTSEASVALKESPGELSFEPNEFPSLTVRVVPAGTTIGCGAGAGVAAAGAGVAGELIAFPPAVFDGADMFWLEELEFCPEGLEAVSAGLLEQATSANRKRMDSTNSAREGMIFTSESNLSRSKL